MGADRGFGDVDKVARHWVRTAPERLVWGSNWPHTSIRPAPGPETIAATQAAWLDTPKLMKQVMVENPAKLYGFEDWSRLISTCAVT